MNAQYEMSSGYVGAMGENWNPVDEATAMEAIDRATAFLHYPSRDDLVRLLNDGRGLSAKTGKQSPNYYYDHGMEKIRAIRHETPKSDLVRCSCGHTVPRSQVMGASMGSSCPNCYDRMSE